MAPMINGVRAMMRCPDEDDKELPAVSRRRQASYCGHWNKAKVGRALSSREIAGVVESAGGVFVSQKDCEAQCGSSRQASASGGEAQSPHHRHSKQRGGVALPPRSASEAG